MAKPTVYGPTYSTYTRSVLLALEEKGVPYELVDVDMFGGAHETPEHLARHPFGKVPAFEHDGFALYETAAVMRYVDDAFDGPALQPAELRERARMTQIIGIVDAYAYPAMITRIVVPRLDATLGGGAPDEAAIAAAEPAAMTALDALEALIGDGALLAGSALSLADLHLAPVYDYFRQTPEGARLLAGTPGLRRWWRAMAARESIVKTMPNLG
ncbi:MAG: glutathione S-transferase family protein [Alphaproteobacteria bacterium]